MKPSILRDKSKAFALHIIDACDSIEEKRGRSILINQLIRSATSIGANIFEGNYAESKQDFIHKFRIALKECFEAEYWIDLLRGCGTLSEEVSEFLLSECGTIRRMLVNSINTATENQKQYEDDILPF